VGGWVDRGFRLIKVKVGKQAVAEDLSRLEAVRERIGPGVRLMIDANEAWDLGEARRRIDAYRHLDLEYVEDPLPVLDIDSYRELRRSAGVPVAGGERLSSAAAARQLIATGGVDVIRADVCRLGGVSEWLAVASLAERFGVAIAPHMVEELALPLACSIPNAHSVEIVPACNLSAAGVVRDAPEPAADGTLAPRSGIGHGVQFHDDALERFLVV
jgi:L-alanine-DL-glutamate epimerase-like enolase superfamily enzyme